MAKTLLDFPLPEIDFTLDGEELLEEIVENVGESGDIVRETRFCEGSGMPDTCYTSPPAAKKKGYELKSSPFPPHPVPPVPPRKIPYEASRNSYKISKKTSEEPPLPILIPGRR